MPCPLAAAPAQRRAADDEFHAARVKPPYTGAAIVMLAGSGLRTGEPAGRKAPDVDSEAGIVRRLSARPSKEGCSPWRWASPSAAAVERRWPGAEDRTRPARDAVLGGLRTGCGREDLATRKIAGQ